MSTWADRILAVKEWGRRTTERTRVRWHPVDHLLRTVQRYQLQNGDRLAGAITYFVFLSLFPITALAFAVFGFVLEERTQIREALQKAIEEQLPGLAGLIDLQGIAQARVSAGVIGLLGLLYAGLGSINALRGALHEISMTASPPLNFVVGKARDLVTLIMIGIALIVSTLLGGFATQATTTVATFLGVETSALAGAALTGVGLAASVGADWVLFLIVLGWVGRPGQPFKVLAQGALLGAIGFGVLKQVATLLLAGTLSNPVYGTFAVTVGLLLWINFSARLTMYVAAWTVTAGLYPPPDPTPLPSGGYSTDS
ncbi:YhjD/YihY/BrkB family envelope integrity protein [Nonomuraea sp. NPDC003804]|uniref:YihY/virulence factor BrkB family protein n=1 Tax=Nonomuraea sp. NPDC003804 TaxID=3154547 RepID=UPI0033B64B6D